MTWLDQRMLLTALNFLICAGIGYVCLCRAAAMSRDTTRKFIRAVYAITAGLATMSAFWFWISGDYTGWDTLAMSTGLLVHMLSGRRGWQNGVPDFAKSAPAPLYQKDLP